MKANYHSHTFRCHHAVGTEREYVEKAIESGLEVLGFSDHSPYIFHDGHYSGFRMRPEELDGYVETLTALKNEYKDDIKILIGLEAEYYPEDFPAYIDFLRGKGVEYLIMGQHYAKGEYPGAVYTAGANDDAQRLTDYVNSVIEGANTGLFSYIAHPDCINYTGDGDFFNKELSRLADGVIAAGLPFEINLLGLREGRNYPSKRFFEILSKRHATVILGSDAHRPEHVYDPVTISRAEELVLQYGLVLTEEIDCTRLKNHGI